MWPAMFGPVWIWGVLGALALGCLLIGLVGFLLLIVGGPRRRPTSRLDELWHWYEEGDLTREEFNRLRRKRST